MPRMPGCRLEGGATGAAGAAPRWEVSVGDRSPPRGHRRPFDRLGGRRGLALEKTLDGATGMVYNVA
jgi:hypothetical protein